jgi:hypothetical protein
MTKSKMNSKSDCQKSTVGSLHSYFVCWKDFVFKGFLGKLSFSLGSFVSSCEVYSVRVVLVSGLVRLYGSLGYVKPN